jgi:hypothetical protein
MIVEELLTPRFKVIAGYPDSKTAVGEIFTLKFRPNNGNVYGIEILGTAGIWDQAYFERYPHLFKKLEWWEERELEQMPLHVKDAFIPSASEYHKVYKVVFDFETNTIILDHCRFTLLPMLHRVLPATEQEYIKNNRPK